MALSSEADAGASSGTLRTHKVSIFGEPLHLRSDQSAQKVEAIAEYLEAKIREVGRGAVNVDRFKLLMLAALNVSGELFEAKEQLNQSHSDNHSMRDAAESLMGRLDRALSSSG
jgi:cell division protein ZapA (FtsZ GTPase activity inhibitor)